MSSEYPDRQANKFDISHNSFFKYFFIKIKIKIVMLDRSIPTKKALIHSIPIREVKDKKSDVLWILKAFLSKQKPFNLVCGLNFNNFQEKKIV
jgi:hypothetical protein